MDALQRVLTERKRELAEAKDRFRAQINEKNKIMGEKKSQVASCMPSSCMPSVSMPSSCMPSAIRMHAIPHYKLYRHQ